MLVLNDGCFPQMFLIVHYSFYPKLSPSSYISYAMHKLPIKTTRFFESSRSYFSQSSHKKLMFTRCSRFTFFHFTTTVREDHVQFSLVFSNKYLNLFSQPSLYPGVETKMSHAPPEDGGHVLLGARDWKLFDWYLPNPLQKDGCGIRPLFMWCGGSDKNCPYTLVCLPSLARFCP